MLKINLSNSVQKFLKTRIPKHYQQISAKIDSLCLDSNPPDNRKLAGKLKGYRRATIGEYRIVYFVKADVLHIVRVDKRNDGRVYRLPL